MSTHWDDIYQKFKQGGEAWATLAEEIHPQFIAFTEQANFPARHALDIGCGTGKYLQYLHERGFAVDGIDNSETALEMTKSLVPSARVTFADMYEYEIPRDVYDLIVSVSTIHHNTKDNVAALVHRIHDALHNGGRIFITMPSWDDARKEKMKHTHAIIAEGTLAPLEGPEKGLAHSFYTEDEMRALFREFKELDLQLDEYKRWVVTGAK